MKNPIYNAKFICADTAWIPATPYFKKTIKISGDVKRATLHITSLGVFEAKINGARVGKDYMTPGWTNYNKRLQFFTYDVTNMLTEESELIVGVGNGWYSSRGGFPESKDGMYGTHPALIAALEILYKDGKSEVVYTDESWLTAKSECLFSGIYDGEITDARIVPEFNCNAKIFDQDKNILIPLEGECVREIEYVEPRCIFTTPAGERSEEHTSELQSP